MRFLIPSLILLGAIGLYTQYAGTNSSVAEAQQSNALVQIEIPSELSGLATIGKRGFDKNCAACHGENAVGQDGVAPPLVVVGGGVKYFDRLLNCCVKRRRIHLRVIRMLLAFSCTKSLLARARTRAKTTP